MDKALITMYAGGCEPLRSVSLPTVDRYAAAHGYEVIEATPVNGLPASWARVPALMQALRRYELAAWIDADAVFLDGAPDLASCLPATAFQGFCHHPWLEFNVNAWLWVVRAGENAAEFLRRVWARRLRPKAQDQPWELSAIHDVLRNDPEILSGTAVLTDWSESTFGREEVERYAKHCGYPHGSYDTRAGALEAVLRDGDLRQWNRALALPKEPA